MEDKIFGYTREELIEMFEPHTEFEKKVSEENKKEGVCNLISTSEFKKNVCVWLQDRIKSSRMSKTDKEYVCDMIGSLMGLIFRAGIAYQAQKSGLLDKLVEEQCEDDKDAHDM